MGLSIRFYLFAEECLQSISQRVMMGLIRGTDATPQYAGTEQKVADFILALGPPTLKVSRACISSFQIRNVVEQKSRALQIYNPYGHSRY